MLRAGFQDGWTGRSLIPDAYAAKAQLRTLQRRVKAWRSERVKEMVLGSVWQVRAVPVEA